MARYKVGATSTKSVSAKPNSEISLTMADKVGLVEGVPSRVRTSNPEMMPPMALKTWAIKVADTANTTDQANVVDIPMMRIDQIFRSVSRSTTAIANVAASKVLIGGAATTCAPPTKTA
ncbi:unannotated protein [freshwater metagenome]|uniref:Unannotated protein n=1 Tax=freshwater metagenome TaxID=449393 RepID=A0A6J6ESE6_9ZZZZ